MVRKTKKCPRCKGSGYLGGLVCGNCGGMGVVNNDPDDDGDADDGGSAGGAPAAGGGVASSRVRR